MTRSTPIQVITVVVLVVLAGCGGLVGGGGSGTATDTTTPQGETTAADADGTPEPTPTPTSTPTQTTTAVPESVTVKGGELDVDASKVYTQLQELLGVSVVPPVVYVTNRTDELARTETSLQRNPFYDVFGYGTDFVNESEPSGFTNRSAIAIDPKSASAARQEAMLVHQLVRWFQIKSDRLDTSVLPRYDGDYDSTTSRTALIQGGAVYVTDVYVDRFMNVSWNATSLRASHYQRGPGGHRVVQAPYYFGARYVHANIDSPSTVGQLYSNEGRSPKTTEQLIHNLSPSEEPERSLSVEVKRSELWLLTTDQGETRGEVSVRTMLRNQHNRSVATRAAAGWGADNLKHFVSATNNSRHGFAWSIRFDSPNQADQFQSAFRTWKVQQSPGNDVAFRQDQVGPALVVILAGDPAFVSRTVAKGGYGNVTIRPPT